MASLGEDVAGQVMSMGTQAVMLLTRLIEQIIQSVKNRNNKELERLQIEQKRRELSRDDAKMYLNENLGLVKYSQMQATGEKMQNLGVNLTEEQAASLGEIYKREGINVCVLKDKELKKAGEKNYLCLFCFEKDLERVRLGLSRVQDEGITKQFVQAGFIKEAEDMQRKSGCEIINEQMDLQNTNRVLNVKDYERMSLKNALTDYTGRAIDLNQKAILADVQDPSKTITVSGVMVKDDNGKDQFLTKYEVNDGRGDIKSFMDNEKEWADKVVETAGFSGTFYKFMNDKEFDRWKQLYYDQNSKEITKLKEAFDNHDYKTLYTDLYNQFKENGGTWKDNVAYDKNNNVCKDVIKDKSFSKAERNDAKELVIITEQLKTVHNMEQVHKDIIVAKANETLTQEGPEHDSAVAKTKELETQYKDLETQWHELTDGNEIQPGQREETNANEAFTQEAAERYYAENMMDEQDYELYNDTVAQEHENRGDNSNREQGDIKDTPNNTKEKPAFEER